MIVVLGIGNELMGDDAFGPLAVKKLESLNFKDTLFYSGETPENFVGKIKDADILIILDTAELGENAGTIKEIKPSEISGHYISTHKIPISFLIKQIKPKKTVFIAAQPKSLEFDSKPSQEIIVAVEKAVEMVEEIIKS